MPPRGAKGCSSSEFPPPLEALDLFDREFSDDGAQKLSNDPALLFEDMLEAVGSWRAALLSILEDVAKGPNAEAAPVEEAYKSVPQVP